MVEVETKLSGLGAVVVQASEIEGHGQACPHTSQYASEAHICDARSQDLIWAVRLASHKVKLNQDLSQRIHCPVKRSKVQHSGVTQWQSLF